jgi:hypothetical protein
MIFSKDGDSEYLEPDDEYDIYDDEEDCEETEQKAMNQQVNLKSDLGSYTVF